VGSVGERFFGFAETSVLAQFIWLMALAFLHAREGARSELQKVPAENL
jgi:hypothetical protein